MKWEKNELTPYCWGFIFLLSVKDMKPSKYAHFLREKVALYPTRIPK